MNRNHLGTAGRAGRQQIKAQRFGTKRPGQALVELTLAVTFLALLFAAAIDLGLAYKSYQTLINATSEASSYLSINPVVSCQRVTCPAEDRTPRGGADLIARLRFRDEQGTAMHGTASTRDLDATGVDDEGERGWTWIADRVKIKSADSGQVTISNSNFSLNAGFNEADTDQECLDRYNFDSSGGPCYIVVQTTINYRPFFLSPALGRPMTITAISVRPVVGNQGQGG